MLYLPEKSTGGIFSHKIRQKDVPIGFLNELCADKKTKEVLRLMENVFFDMVIC